MRKNEKITALYERLSRDDFGKDDQQQDTPSSGKKRIEIIHIDHDGHRFYRGVRQ